MRAKSILLLVVFILNDCLIQSVPNLPGLDHVQSGFDASAMVSPIDLEVNVGDKSKFTIFNLTEPGSKFTLKANGHTKVFETSAMTQVTDLSIRKENYCEAITASFSMFYKYYFESTSFQAGISAGPASASIKYSKVLEQAYNETTGKNKAIGISTTWWGLYSIQLPPPFLIPLDRQFARSLNVLNSIGTPSTDAHQRLYKQVVQSFGTHYVSSVIVGGTVSMYTFLANEYHSVTSYRKVEEQISLNFQWEKANLTGSSQSISLEQQISSDFKKNAQVVTVYHPTVAESEGKLLWNIWLEKAALQPVVVNRTVAPMYDLVYDSPTVQTHLQKTVNFYIKNGRHAETLREVNS